MFFPVSIASLLAAITRKLKGSKKIHEDQEKDRTCAMMLSRTGGKVLEWGQVAF